MSRLPKIIALLLATLPCVASAQAIAFDDRWLEQRLTIFGSNQYSLNGDSLGVISDGTVSLLWTRLPEIMWQTSEASWEWMVDRSVPPTDLTLKGGDDRNLSLYFIFLPDEAARAATHVGPRALLDNPDARVLVYVWGGAYERGQILPSPYLGARGRSVVKRAAGEGAAAERVNLARDHVGPLAKRRRGWWRWRFRPTAMTRARPFRPASRGCACGDGAWRGRLIVSASAVCGQKTSAKRIRRDQGIGKSAGHVILSSRDTNVHLGERS